MADLKISQLPAVTSPSTSDVFPIVDSGVTSKLTIANLQAAVKAAGSDITTGTDDAKFATSKALKDAGVNHGADFLVQQVLL